MDRQSRPCLLLGPEYCWKPTGNYSYYLLDTKQNISVKQGNKSIVLWGHYGAFCGPEEKTDTTKYTYSFEEAAHILETQFLTGAIK